MPGGFLLTVVTNTYFWNKCMGEETVMQWELLAVLPPPHPRSLLPTLHSASPKLAPPTIYTEAPPTSRLVPYRRAPPHLSPSLRDARNRGQVSDYSALAQEALLAGGGRGLQFLDCGDKENTERIRKGVGSGSERLGKGGHLEGVRRVRKENLLETDPRLHAMSLLPLIVEVIDFAFFPS